MYEIDIIKTNLKLGEGPHWVASEQALYLVDIPAGKVLRIDGKTNKITSTCPKGKERLTALITSYYKLFIYLETNISLTHR